MLKAIKTAIKNTFDSIEYKAIRSTAEETARALEEAKQFYKMYIDMYEDIQALSTNPVERWRAGEVVGYYYKRYNTINKLYTQ